MTEFSWVMKGQALGLALSRHNDLISQQSFLWTDYYFHFTDMETEIRRGNEWLKAMQLVNDKAELESRSPSYKLRLLWEGHLESVLCQKESKVRTLAEVGRGWGHSCKVALRREEGPFLPLPWG